MDKAGSIIAIVAGVLGLLGGFVTLFIGGLGGAFAARDAGTLIGLGWGGIAAALLVIVAGAISLSRPRGGGMAVVFVGVVGIVHGGTLVAICLLLALIGGSLAVLAPATAGDTIESPRKRWQALAMSLGAGLAVLVLTSFIGPGEHTKGDPQVAAAIRIGETAGGDRFAVTLHSFALRDAVGFGHSYTQAPPGTVFAVLEVSVKCIDRESRWYLPGDLIANLGDQTLKFDQRESLYGVTESFGQINPLTEEKGVIVFKLPKEAMNAELTWHPGRGAGESPFTLKAPATAAVPAKPVPVAPTGMETYRLGGSTLEFTQQADGAVNFKLLIVSDDGNTGEAEGTIHPREGIAAWKDTAFGCELAFRWLGQGVQIAQNGTCGFGAGVVADGVYSRH